MAARTLVTLTVVLGIAATSCSSDEKADDAPISTVEPVAEIVAETAASPGPQQAPSPLGDVSEIVDAVKGGLVVIYNLGTTFGEDGEFTIESLATGSGVVVDDDGGIVTNRHVIQGGDTVAVQGVDGRLRGAAVVAVLGETSDLAFLRVEEHDGLVPVPLGQSLEAEVGDVTIALGNPRGLGLSASTGIISARGQRISVEGADLFDLLQTDAAINPGNSGGPLLDSTGRVIGINTAVRDESEGLGFAISVEQVRAFVTAVRERSEIPYVGVGFVTLDQARLDQAGTTSNGGVGVLSPLIDGPADRGGLARNDIIIELDGASVTTATEVADAISASEPGETITLRVLRPKIAEIEELEVEIEVGAQVLSTPSDDDG